MTQPSAHRDSPPFACPCCGGSKAKPAGLYRLPPKRDPEGGLLDISYPLVECEHCRHVAAHPIPSQVDVGHYYGSKAFWKTQGVSADESSSGWYRKLTENSSLWERFCRARRQMAFVRRNLSLPEDANIIDLGSGYSPFLYFCREAGFRKLYALEPYDEICAYLERQGVTAYPQLLEDFVVREDLPKFDLMVISHTLEHLIDPAGVLDGLRRHLAPNGILFVDVPFQDHLRPYKQGLHYQFFSHDSIASLAERTGFAVKATEHDRYGAFESHLIGWLFSAYGMSFATRGGITARPGIDFLHKFAWRPVKSLLGLNINIFISTLDLRALLRRQA